MAVSNCTRRLQPRRFYKSPGLRLGEECSVTSDKLPLQTNLTKVIGEVGGELQSTSDPEAPTKPPKLRLCVRISYCSIYMNLLIHILS